MSGHLLKLTGEPADARESYVEAARRTGSLPQQRHLNARAVRLEGTVAER